MAAEKLHFKARHHRCEGIRGRVRTCYVREKFLGFLPDFFTIFRAIVIPAWWVLHPSHSLEAK